MNILQKVSLAPYTSLRVGGTTEELLVVESYDEMLEAIKNVSDRTWLLGFGCNVLISDEGLPGRTIICRKGNIKVNNNEVVADAGVWWDDVVLAALNHRLWGLELMSAIPSSVGGAVFGNIAAYGQQVSDTLSWVELFDTTSKTISRHSKDEFEFTYRLSSLQNQPEKIVLRAGFQLSQTPLHELRYDSALAIADDMNLDHRTLEHCRTIIMETRRRAGSLYSPDDAHAEHTAGSFFKNPIVTTEQAKVLATYDETGKTLERIENQSRIHGGNSHRASAAHVLLAAGFHRGQTWGNVRLHPQHVLKLETLDGATATEVYNVVQKIITTVKTKLDINLEPEVKFLGF